MESNVSRNLVGPFLWVPGRVLPKIFSLPDRSPIIVLILDGQTELMEKQKAAFLHSHSSPRGWISATQKYDPCEWVKNIMNQSI